jgi:DNA-binding NarL/FixJ family response regulator
MTTRPHKVLIADDHPIVREGLHAILTTLPDFELTASVASGTEAVEAAAKAPPDIVIMDLHMPDLDGSAATRQILAAHPHVAVLVLTMYENDEMLASALRAGARGYLVKGASRADISRALRAVAAGDAVFDSAVAGHVLARFSGRAPIPEPFPQLTRRELEILQLLALGDGTQSIARRLYLSPKTVRNHIASILAKLDLPDRSQAIAAAREAGLGSRQTPDPGVRKP